MAYKQSHINIKEKQPDCMIDIRLSLVTLLCLEHEKVFNPLTIDEQFREYFENTGRVEKVLNGS